MSIYSFPATTAEGTRDCVVAAKWAVTVEPCTAVPAYTGQKDKWQADAATVTTVGVTAADDRVPDTTDTVTAETTLTGLSHATLLITTW